MSAITFAIAAALFHLAPVQTVKKCEKIDACRCSTDEGEINLWSLGSESPGQPRYVSSAARWVSTGFYKHKTSKAKGNDKRGVPRASFSACRRPSPVSLSRTSKRRYRGPINRSIPPVGYISLVILASQFLVASDAIPLPYTVNLY